MKFSILIISILLLASCSGTKGTNADYERSLDLAKNYLERMDALEIKEDAQSYYIDGVTKQQKGLYAESIIDFRLALEVDSSAAILFSLSRSYLQLGRTKLAIRSLIRSLELNEDFVPSIELLASVYVSVGELESAIPLLERVNELEPSIDRKLDLAELYESTNPEKAKKQYREIYKKYNNFEALRRLSGLLDPETESEEYIESLEEYYSTNKSNSNAAYSLLEAYLLNDKVDEILLFLEDIDTNIITEDLERFYGKVGYDILYDSLLSFSDDQTAYYLDMIDNRFIFNWRMQYQSGFIAGKIKDYELSLKFFDNTLKLLDTIPDIHLQIGLFYLNEEQDKFSEEIFGLGSELFPDDERFQFFLGLSQFNQNKDIEAIQSFKTALEINNEYIDAFIQLGICYDRQMDLDKAIYYYEKALEIEPKNPLANNNLAYSLSIQNKDLERAKQLSEIALKKQPDNSAYLDTYGWILYLLGDFENSIIYLEKAIKDDPSAEVLEHYGDALLKNNKDQKAVKAWKRSLELEPDRESVIKKLKKSN